MHAQEDTGPVCRRDLPRYEPGRPARGDKALLVDGSATGYLKSACDYVHLNPVRAGLLSPEQPLEAYRWRSYPLYTADSRRPSWLRIDRLLGEW